MVNIALGILFAICMLNSDLSSESSFGNAIFPVLSTALFVYFLVYGILWFFERRLFPNSTRPSDYLDGKSPSLAEIGDDEMPPEEEEKEDSGLDPWR